VAIGASTEVHALSAERVRAAVDELMARDTASCAARS
jgi:hypothetical protein